MKAVILAAGKGTRLRNLIGDKPKALLEIQGIPIIERVVRTIIKAGIKEIIVIIRRNAEIIEDFLIKKNLPVDFKFIKRNTKSAMFSFFALEKYLKDSAFFLFTVDCVYNELKMIDFINFSKKSNADLVIATTHFIQDEKPVYVIVDENGNISTFGRNVGHSTFISAGVYYCSPRIYSEKNFALEHGICHLSDFLGMIVKKKYSVLGFDLGKVIDIDNYDDVKEAIQFVKRYEKEGLL